MGSHINIINFIRNSQYGFDYPNKTDSDDKKKENPKWMTILSHQWSVQIKIKKLVMKTLKTINGPKDCSHENTSNDEGNNDNQMPHDMQKGTANIE